jgi:hypothetical protein
VNDDSVSGDVLQNAIVSCGSPAAIMLLLQAVDGNSQMEIVELAPGCRDGPNGAGDKLHLNAQRLQFRQQLVKLPVADQGFTSNDGDMKGTKLPDERQNLSDQFLALEVGELA